MRITGTTIPDVLLVEPLIYSDARGFFLESYNQREFEAATGIGLNFVQDNHSRSSRGVLRGLHFQTEHPQGKLVRVVAGAIYDVAIDLRPTSTTLGKWVGVELTAHDHRQLWIPPGFAHGFLTLTDSAELLYKATDYYAPQHERCIAWNDPTLRIAWPLKGEPILSARDQAGVSFASIFSG